MKRIRARWSLESALVLVAIALIYGHVAVARSAPSTFVVADTSASRGTRTDDTGSPRDFGPALDRAVERAMHANANASAIAPTQIRIVYHVLSGPAGEGNVGDEVIAAQTAALNDAYAPMGFHFAAAEIRRHPDSPFFFLGGFTTTEEGAQMRMQLAVDPVHFVNVYVLKMQLPLLVGVSSLPDEFPEGDHRHAIAIDYGTLPGGTAPLDLGRTLVHEMGHYLGLLHTFEGGCDGPGDSVADTPAEAIPGYGCAVGRDSCAMPGIDPITNYMDYSDDACMTGFTPLQGTRMHALVDAFRPELANASFAIGPGMTGNWYNPAQSGHGLGVEVLDGDQLLVEWYVYTPSGEQAWIVAQGAITGDSAELQAYQEVGPGARFPPDFDPSRLENRAWGTLTLRFTDCNTGELRWQPVIAGYTAGSMPISRLTMPKGLSCP